MRDHILSEVIAKHNGILEHCMYCDTNFNHDTWKVEPIGFDTYISNICLGCKKEHRFKDNTIHTIEDLLEKIK